MSYLRAHAQHRVRPTQGEPMPCADQVQNSDGAYVFALDPLARLRRFLILGSEGGSYYANQRELTNQNIKVLDELLNTKPFEKTPGAREAIDLIVEVAEGGLAHKQQPAIYAFAIACSHPHVSHMALDKIPRVCRTGEQLLQFVSYCDELRGWGRGFKSRIAAWFEREDIRNLAYQTTKYQNRHGWTMRDVLRQAHPKAPTVDHRALYEAIVRPNGEYGLLKSDLVPDSGEDHPLLIVEGARRVQDVMKVTNPFRDDAKIEYKAGVIADLIREYKLTHEMVPTEVKNVPAVQEALLENMPIGALVRNLGAYTASGLLTPTSAATSRVLSKLSDPVAIRKSKIHPMAVLFAAGIYQQGHGLKGNLEWIPVSQIVAKLGEVFHDAFHNVESTGLRWQLSLDVSASMDWHSSLISGTTVTARVAAAAMSMVTARSEPLYEITAFSGDIVPLPIGPDQRINDVLSIVDDLPAGSTDCSLPMRWAKHHQREVDVFVVYTDSETNRFNREQPIVALKDYRKAINPNAKLIVVGMASNGFSIADPADQGMLDVVGFDASAPALMAEFAVGKI